LLQGLEIRGLKVSSRDEALLVPVKTFVVLIDADIYRLHLKVSGFKSMKTTNDIFYS
jgi:hypothetical protein